MLNDQLEFLRDNVIIESPHRYVFQSSSNRDVSHIVDLEDNYPIGECSCEHFQFKIKKLLDQRIIKPNSQQAVCKHMRVAKDLFYEMMIKLYVNQINKS
tara:strand:+ start:1411 stop:1707 length:297 start_codon:yes stop_codon:yes gene_type:complete